MPRGTHVWCSSGMLVHWNAHFIITTTVLRCCQGEQVSHSGTEWATNKEQRLNSTFCTLASWKNSPCWLFQDALGFLPQSPKQVSIVFVLKITEYSRSPCLHWESACDGSEDSCDKCIKWTIDSGLYICHGHLLCTCVNAEPLLWIIKIEDH